MSTINDIEDLVVWQKSRTLNVKVYSLTKAEPFINDFVLRDLARRSSLSVMANIAEGFGREGKNEFIQFLTIAKGSLEEVKSHLYAALDLGYMKKDEFDLLMEDIREIKLKILSFIKYLKSSELRGRKFKQTVDGRQ